MRAFAIVLCIAAVVQNVTVAQAIDGTREQIEADWLLAAELSAQSIAALTTESDAAGGCDGVKDGKWGFHTAPQENPWWQVDLGGEQALGRVAIWNRCDAVAARAARLSLLLSRDGKSWRSAYTHNGKTFFGASDGKPLEVKLAGASARFVRVQLAEKQALHLDEVEVFSAGEPEKNIALYRPANQSSVSQWSVSHAAQREVDWAKAMDATLRQGATLIGEGSSTSQAARLFQASSIALRRIPTDQLTKEHHLHARRALRSLVLDQRLLDFDDLLFVKRIPGTYSHMSDQYYGWWSRPGGGVFVLKNWKSAAGLNNFTTLAAASPSPLNGERAGVRGGNVSERDVRKQVTGSTTPHPQSLSPLRGEGRQRLRGAEIVCLTAQFARGSFLRPELSYDGKCVLFSYCRFHPDVRENKDKTDKANLPEDAFYHVFEMNIDGSNARQLTHGHYDDFSARYLPGGEIVFLSTRRGTFVQANKHCATSTLEQDALPDSYVRCGGGNWRPVAVYTLHVMDRNGANLRAISPFENFEWDPVVANDGRIVYARWDYVDRDNMPYMSLWSTNPDGTNPQLVYGNHTKSPYGVFEARPIPNSRKFIFTASAHHSISGGSLCVLDSDYGTENAAPLTRLTPEVKFPEIEGWSQTWYGTPYPLSEKLFLAAWSPRPLRHEGQPANETNALGLYVYHASGIRELVYRDADVSSCDPIPVRARLVPPVISSSVAWDGNQEGRFLMGDVYQGLEGVPVGTVKALRVVGVPAKTQPQMNSPQLGVTADDPGKFVLGTVPVEADGSAHFRVPSGVNVFFQALDQRGVAIQTMRTVTYVQPGQTLACVGCHEHRSTAPPARAALAAMREPSKLTPAPDGSWPLRFEQLVQPMVESKCVRCHEPKAKDRIAAKFDLTAPRSYDSLINFGKPSLREHVRKQYNEGRSPVNEGTAQKSALLTYLESDAVHQRLLDSSARERLITWMDVYGQRLGSFSDEQERRLAELRANMAALLNERKK